MPAPLPSAPPCSLYVHIPWCVRKCPYCDFNSHKATSELPEQAYLTSLLADLDEEIHYFQKRRDIPLLSSVFIGGGTPSLLSTNIIADIINAANSRIGFSDKIEITLEANPGAVDREKFKGLRIAGVNRLSIGVQSFSPAKLTALGRIHSPQDISNAYQWARQCGFTNINLDLMFGLPGQTFAQALQDLATAIALAPEHISWYQLTIEPNTEFYSQPPALPDDDQVWDIHQAGIRLLQEAGYEQYEVSAFALPGKPSRHNLNYWHFGDYLAIGAGAHSKCTDSQHGEITRHWKTRQPQHYLNRIGSYRSGQEIIKTEQLPFEYLMNALRLKQGVTEEAFPLATGLAGKHLEPQLSTLRRQGLLDISRLQCTAQGYLHLNSVLAEFLTE